MCYDYEETGYGIPYAIYVHDIERIEEVSTIREVNERMSKGQVLLAIVQYSLSDLHCGNVLHRADPGFIMGVPRPQWCDNTRIPGHPRNQAREWSHQYKRWECRWCLEHKAEKEDMHHNTTKPDDNIPF